MILALAFAAFYVLIPLAIIGYVAYRLVRELAWRASDMRLINQLTAIAHDLRTDPQQAIRALGDLSRTVRPRGVHIPALSLFYSTLLDVRGGLSTGELTLSSSPELRRFLSEIIDQGIKSMFGERSAFFVALSNLVLLSLQTTQFKPLAARDIKIEDSDEEIEFIKQFRMHTDEIPYHARGTKIQDWLIRFQDRELWKTLPANKIFIVFYINAKINRSLKIESRLTHYGRADAARRSQEHAAAAAEIRSAIPSLVWSMLTDLENAHFAALMRTIELDHTTEKLCYARINVGLN